MSPSALCQPQTSVWKQLHSEKLSVSLSPHTHTHGEDRRVLSSWPFFEAAVLAILDLGCAADSLGSFFLRKCFDLPPKIWSYLAKYTPSSSRVQSRQRPLSCSLCLAHPHHTPALPPLCWLRLSPPGLGLSINVFFWKLL